jgi:hypothetical protein
MSNGGLYLMPFIIVATNIVNRNNLLVALIGWREMALAP